VRSINGATSKTFAAGWEILLPHSMLTVERSPEIFINRQWTLLNIRSRPDPPPYTRQLPANRAAGKRPDQPPADHGGRETGGT
jgi:hypothetical protein